MSNHIDHIEITNFKSIRHAKIEGCKRINVFIGYPNVGKSAILEAMSSLCYLQRDFNQSFNKLCRLRSVTELFHNGNLKEDAVIQCNERAKAQFKYLSDTVLDLKTEQFVINGDDPNDKGTWYMLKNLRFIGEKADPAQKSQSQDIARVRKYSFQNAAFDIRSNALDFSFPDGENLTEVIQFDKGLRREVSELFKFYNLKFLIDQATNSMRGLQEIDDETIYAIPFHQMADTLQRLIFYKAAIMSNRDTVLLFEEPEAHMFPPYITKFTGDIIFEKQNGNQYFISTHSPFVMNDFLEESRDELSVYLVGLKAGETVVKRLNDEELHEVYQYGVDLFFNIESYLD